MSWALGFHGKVADARQAITAQRTAISKGISADDQALLNSSTELVLLTIGKEPQAGSVSIEAVGSTYQNQGQTIRSVSISIAGAYP